MNVNDVTKYIKRFVSKSKFAWKIYLEQFSEPKLTIEQFIEHYKPKEKEKDDRKRRTSLEKA